MRISYLSNSHASAHWPNASTDSSQQANLHTIDGLVKFFDLIMLWCLVIPLIGDCGISLGIDVFFFELVRHLECWCGCEGLVKMSSDGD